MGKATKPKDRRAAKYVVTMGVLQKALQIPEDIVSAKFNHNSDCLEVFVRGKSLEAIPEGGQVPIKKLKLEDIK